jgi:hypothetical protein
MVDAELIAYQAGVRRALPAPPTGLSDSDFNAALLYAFLVGEGLAVEEQVDLAGTVVDLLTAPAARKRSRA